MALHTRVAPAALQCRMAEAAARCRAPRRTRRVVHRPERRRWRRLRRQPRDRWCWRPRRWHKALQTTVQVEGALGRARRWHTLAAFCRPKQARNEWGARGRAAGWHRIARNLAGRAVSKAGTHSADRRSAQARRVRRRRQTIEPGRALSHAHRRNLAAWLPRRWRRRWIVRRWR